MNRKELTIVMTIAFFVGAIGSIVFDRLIIPPLVTIPKLSWLKNLQSTTPIVITRREEIQLNEGANLMELSKQAGAFTVSIFSQGLPRFLGNGIIVTSDGLIFTTRQVAGDQKEVAVLLDDGRIFTALIRAADPKSDLMVLSIEANNLPLVQFEDAANLKAGQRILAVGRSNQAYTHKFSAGFVTNSVINNTSLEQVRSSERAAEAIDTDIKLNQEMIGGPLLNLQGHVVAMAASNEGLILAEHMRTALSVYLATNKITRPYLGIQYVRLTKELAAIKGFPEAGALVIATESGSLASKAALLPNDLIFKFEGQKLNSQSFEALLNNHPVADLKLTVLREGKTMEIVVKLEAR